MKFDWNEYLRVAQKIASGSSQIEATQRTAVSRAYYAIHHLCGGFAANNGYSKYPKSGGGHSDLFCWYKYSKTNSSFQAVGTKLQRMFQCRVQCDYFDEVSDLPSKVEYVLAEAESIKNLLGTQT